MDAKLATLIVFACLLFSVLVGSKVKLSAGIIALFFAFFLGMNLFDLGTSDILDFFPTNIVISFIMGMCFFGYVRRAGVFEKISQWIIFVFRKNSMLLPFAIAMCSTILTAMGCDIVASTTIMAPIAYTVAIDLGYSPLLACVGIWAGTSAGAFPYLIISTAVPRSIITELMGSAYVDITLWYKWITAFALNYFYVSLVYFFTGAHKQLKGKRMSVCKPEQFTGKEKKVLLVLCVYIFFMVMPSVVNMLHPNPVASWCITHINTFVLFGLGTVVLNTFDIAEGKEVLQEDISWELIVMISGTTMLLKLLTVAGTIDMIGSWIGNSVPEMLIIPLVFLCGAIMTMFTNANVALQTLAPLFFTVVEYAPSVPTIGTFVALWIGATGPTIAPFSTGGALALMMCPEAYKEKLMRQELVMAVLVALIGLCISLLGWFNWMRP